MVVTDVVNGQESPFPGPVQAGNAVELGVEIPVLHYGHADALRHRGGIGHLHQLVPRHNAGRAHHHPAVQGGALLHRHACPQVIVAGVQLQLPLHGNLGPGGAGKLHRTQYLGGILRKRVFPVLNGRSLFSPHHRHGFNVGKLRRARKIQIDGRQELRIKTAVRLNLQGKNGTARDAHHHRIGGRSHLHLRIHLHGDAGHDEQVVQLQPLVLRRRQLEHQGARSGGNARPLSWY